MKKENILLPISIIILGGCLILSAWIVTNGLKNNEHLDQSLNNTTQAKALMTSNEAAQYMGISLNEFDLLITSQVREKAVLRSYDTYRYIPFIVIGNQRFFNETEIDKWIEYNMLNK
ncbi:DNA-binding protein [Paenibacillus albiflavus]|uniref:DNA-binding protein n=1 Tax=Paenibacillus albiflavus TaxID=2545760 RepID=A0A4R4ERU6_9BACL|nr:helix-turn-helix domain-containing protein [Paenibacillus albiflavus]TCZ81168.1 DNA-binding protein [Paenibacillus albiflavus]